MSYIPDCQPENFTPPQLVKFLNLSLNIPYLVLVIPYLVLVRYQYQVPKPQHQKNKRGLSGTSVRFLLRSKKCLIHRALHVRRRSAASVVPTPSPRSHPCSSSFQTRFESATPVLTLNLESHQNKKKKKKFSAKKKIIRKIIEHGR